MKRTLPERQRRIVDDAAFSARIRRRVDLRVDERLLAELGDRSRLVGPRVDSREELAELVVLLLAERGQDGV